MSKDKTFLFRLGETKINGVICSGNKWWFAKKPISEEINITCSTVVLGNPTFDGIFYSSF